MNVKSFTVGEQVFNATMASAVKQDELLGLLSAKIFLGFEVASRKGETLGEKEIMVMLMTLPIETKNKIASILTEKVFLNGTQIPVSVKDFQGKMVEWNKLLAQLLQWNLSDFFDFTFAEVNQNNPQTPNP